MVSEESPSEIIKDVLVDLLPEFNVPTEEGVLCTEVLIDEEEEVDIGEEEREGEKDAQGTPPIPTPSATHIPRGLVLEGHPIDESMHMLNPIPTNLAEDILSSSVERTRRDPSLTSSFSQKDGDFNIRIRSPKDSTPHKEASVVSPHESEHPEPASEAGERITETKDLEHPKSPLDTSARIGSETFVHDIDRTRVGSPSQEVQRSRGSPRVGNIKSATEGALDSKATKSPCVDDLGSPGTYVTNEEFRTFATEVFKRLDALKNSSSSSIPATEADKVTEALKELTSTTTQLKNSLTTLQRSVC